MWCIPAYIRLSSLIYYVKCGVDDVVCVDGGWEKCKGRCFYDMWRKRCDKGRSGGKIPLSPRKKGYMQKKDSDRDVLRRRRRSHRLRRRKICRGPSRGPYKSPGKPPEGGKHLFPLCVSGEGTPIRVPPLCSRWWEALGHSVPFVLVVMGRRGPEPPLYKAAKGRARQGTRPGTQTSDLERQDR